LENKRKSAPFDTGLTSHSVQSITRDYDLHMDRIANRYENKAIAPVVLHSVSDSVPIDHKKRRPPPPFPDRFVCARIWGAMGVFCVRAGGDIPTRIFRNFWNPLSPRLVHA